MPENSALSTPSTSSVTTTAPDRLSAPAALYPLNHQGLPGYPFLSPKSLVRPISSLERVHHDRLRRFSRTIPAFSAIQKITKGVLSFPWRIDPPAKLAKNKSAIVLAEYAERSLRKPNIETLGSYRNFISAIVDDLLVINYACIERQPGNSEHPFWLWPANSAKLRLNPAWTPQNDGVTAKFIDYGQRGKAIGISSENMFMLLNNVNTYEALPPSPLEVAYGLIEAWLGLSDFQQATTNRATQEYILDLGTATKENVKAFQEYWDVEVIQQKKTAMGAFGGQLRSVKIGAVGDDGLYPRYCEYLLRIIALAFALSNRDSNIVESDNRATAGVSADATFSLAIKPIAQTIFEGLADEVVDYYLPTFRLIPTYKETRSESAVNAEIREDFKAGIISRDEARRERGLDAIDGENVFAIAPAANPAALPSAIG